MLSGCTAWSASLTGECVDLWMTPELTLYPHYRYVVQRPAADRARSCDLAEVLVTQLGVVVGHLQPLETLLNKSTQQSCACHVTRLSLHIHWTALSVAYRLSPLVGERDCTLTCTIECVMYYTMECVVYGCSQDGAGSCAKPRSPSQLFSPMLHPSLPPPASQAATAPLNCGCC